MDYSYSGFQDYFGPTEFAPNVQPFESFLSFPFTTFRYIVTYNTISSTSTNTCWLRAQYCCGKDTQSEGVTFVYIL
jgi:hypothetical protein